MLAGFENAVRECAAPIARPLGRLALPPPQSWFEAAPAAAAVEGAAEAARGTAGGAAPAPAFAAVWCSEDALRCHTLRWLVLCALRLDIDLGAAGPGPAGGPSGFCDTLRGRLHRLAVANCLRGRAGAAAPVGAAAAAAEDGIAAEQRVVFERERRMAVTELCAVAAAAAALCRAAGQLQVRERGLPGLGRRGLGGSAQSALWLWEGSIASSQRALCSPGPLAGTSCDTGSP